LAKSSVKCVRDIRDVGPQFYRLPTDGKKWLHVCRQRQQLALWLATFADGDGSRITTGTKRMENALFLSRRTLFRLLDDLRALGFLTGGKLTGYQGTRRRELNVAAILAAPSVVPHTPVVPNTVVPDSATDAPDRHFQSCHIDMPVVPDSATDVPDRRPVVPKTADFETEPSVRTDTQTATSTVLSDRKTKLENGTVMFYPKGIPEEEEAVLSHPTPTPPKSGGAVVGGDQELSDEEYPANVCGGCGKPLPVGQDYCNDDCEEKFIEFEIHYKKEKLWSQFYRALPRDLAAASFQKGQQEKLKQMCLLLGLPTMRTIVKAWLMRRAMPVEGLRTNRWGKFLEEYLPYVKIVQTDWQEIEAEWQRCKSDFM
jgi:hypothetical protein